MIFISIFSYSITFLLLIITTMVTAGHLRKKYKVPVYITRKLVHVVLFFLPGWLLSIYSIPASVQTLVITGMSLIILTRVLELSSSITEKALFSIDRPEDEPHTIFLLRLEIACTYTAIIIMFLGAQYLEVTDFLAPIFTVVMIADAAGEVVGRIFGRTHYRVYSLIPSQKHFRTIEGSGAFFIFTLLIIVAYNPLFTATPSLTILVVPLALTITEALSPHTFDTPFLIISYSTMIGIIYT
jgi:hypothetical protein